MKPPSRNIGKSLRDQHPPGRGTEHVEQARPKAFSPSMTVPGEGGTVVPQGTTMEGDGRHDRSANHHAGALGQHFGNGS
jgi:hypothetical protein